MNTESKKIVTQFLAISGLSAMCTGLVFGTYMVYLTEWGGLTYLDANLVNVFFFLTMFVSEVPTGAFADTYGRKTSVVVSYVIAGVGVLSYGLTKSFWGFVVAEALIAFGRTFETGAFDSWVQDRLKEADDDVSYKDIVARYTPIISNLGTAVGALVGGYLATLDIRVPMITEGLFHFVLAALVAVWLKEGTLSTYKPEHWRELFEKIKKGFRQARENASIAFLLVAGFGLCLSLKSFHMFWALRFKDLGEHALGWIPFMFMLCLMLGSWSVAKVFSKTGEKILLTAIIGVTAVLVFVSAVTPNLFVALGPLLCLQFFQGIWRTKKSQFVAASITDSDTRATVSSAAEVFNHLAGALGLLMAGVIGEVYGIEVSWVVSSAVLFGFFAFLLWRR